jgi:hypothetical protein
LDRRRGREAGEGVVAAGDVTGEAHWAPTATDALRRSRISADRFVSRSITSPGGTLTGEMPL